MSYEDLEKAMEDKNDPNYQKYLKIRKNFKMNPIPVANLMNNLNLTNSLTNKKEIFTPINSKKFLYMRVDLQYMTILTLETHGL